jgi:tryptophan-rich sensory protein
MNYILLIICLIIPQLAGFIGSIFNRASISTWYPLLVKPSFNPPNWIFAPVWIFLFVLMGISLYLVLIESAKVDTKTALIIFSIQLTLNILWSFCFFYLQSPLLGLIDIILLLIFIVLNIIVFYSISPISAYLLTPYLLWVIFATILNISILVLN